MRRHAATATSRVTMTVAGILVCLAGAGCAPPAVSVHHELPAALPTEQPPETIQLGKVSVVEPATQPVSAVLEDNADAPRGGEAVRITPELAEFMKEQLSRALPAVWKSSQPPTTRPGPKAATRCEVSPTIRAVVRDARGTRQVLRVDSSNEEVTPVELPTLVRWVRMRVIFNVACSGGGQAGKRFGAVEVTMKYNSALDPNVRGELGLDRPDDPNRVPPVKTIVADLLDGAADVFGRAIASTPIDKTIQLRKAPGPAVEKGFAAVREKSWLVAMNEFQNALGDRPDDAVLHFNLAAAAEAGDRLDLAQEHYQRAFDLSGEQDVEAGDGARRCRRVTEARKALIAPAGAKSSASQK